MLTSTRYGIVFSAAIVFSTATRIAPSTALEARADQPPVVHVAPIDDGRVATVVDRQGTALVRPVGRERWSPLRQRALLMPGDLVRTSVRGANALEARFDGGGKLIVGPGSLVELTGTRAVKLYRGEVSVETEAGAKGVAAPIQVTGPGGFEQSVKTSLIARVQGGRTNVLEKAPRWLSGYRESTTDEWVGSLIAKVDGRDVPMSVGYHKVEAVIRDQIAQTTVEQSFINSTKNRLEGVFYFPLPADASISGFGMWIGGELVEADIVEKQRARQIYEDILRRKKDPGLLEWSGGNLFKARVFPIEPHSEKRIRIRYTQVLPMEGSTVRYRYALRSELLRKRPLRSLAIKVSVSSEMKIVNAASSTHEMRVRRTDHAATMEFDAQEFTPEKDFEVAITLDRGNSLTVVPHRRGDDGYFMMLLTPPSAASGKWQRDLMPEGKPVDLIIIADTSASMDTAARESQADFIRALLSMLGQKDKFRLMTADLDVQNFAADPSAVNEKSIESAMAFLANRDSLGWTDLDRVLARIDAEAKAGTVVVYVGDGIGTTGDADPVALAKRVRRLGDGCKGIVHAVSTGSTYEQGVLEALASLGGGSVRSIGQDPSAAAYELLAEAAQPAVKDLRIAFEGIRTARVYPEVPANLPVGRQQVILGRFLSTGQDQSGRAIVTGTLEGRSVRYSAPIKIKAGEVGNSFLPRLWARRHLDALLSQGRSTEVQEDIVAFSIEFGIMTPYTSLLVLENDEDRKRYGVERRVGMRDGEKFFAKGRDDASTEILRQQMRGARTYRLQLRLRMLNEIAELGRSLRGWAVAYSPGGPRNEWNRSLRLGGGARVPASAMVRDEMPPGEFSYKSNLAIPMDSLVEDAGGEFLDFDKKTDEGLRELEALELPAEKKSIRMVQEVAKGMALRSPARKRAYEGAYGFFDRRRDSPQAYRPYSPRVTPPYDFSYFGFPQLAGPGKVRKGGKRGKWSKEILDLFASLDRRERLAKSDLGFLFESDVDYVHELQGRITSWNRTAGFYAGGEWAQRATGPNSQPMWTWVHGDRRGILAASLGLGRQRDANDLDRRFQFPLLDYSTRDFSRTYAGYVASLTALDQGKVKIVLAAQKPSTYRLEFTIDRDRRVVTQFATVREGKTTMMTTLSDFVEKGGMFWARKIETKNAKGRVTWRRTLSVETGTRKDVAALIKTGADRADAAIMLGYLDPNIEDAKQAIHAGKAGIPERLRIVTHYAATQQWEKVWEAWRRVVTKITARAAIPIMRLKLQAASRMGEEFKASLDEIIAKWPELAARPQTTPVGIDFLVGHVRRLANNVLSNTERLTLLETLEPVIRRPGKRKSSVRDLADRRQRDIQYRTEVIGFFNSMGRLDEALRLREQTAQLYADDFRVVIAFVQALGRASDRARQSSVLAAALNKKNLWLESEVSQYYRTWLGALFYLRDLPGLERVAKAWMKRVPDTWESYHIWLASLMFRNRGAEVDGWVRVELAKAPSDDVQRARLRAAARQALGQGWNMGSNTVRAEWQNPLADLVRRCVKTGGQLNLQFVQEIVGNYQFRRTDAFLKLTKGFLADLLGADGIAKLSLDRLAIYMRWVPWGRNSIDRADWEQVRDALQARFAAAEDVGSQGAFGRYVLQVLDAWPETESALAFLRQWMTKAKANPENVARDLFNRLLRQGWTKSIEAEVFSLVAKLQPENVEVERRMQIAMGAIRKLSDSLITARIRANLGQIEELEKLSRQERRDREKRARKAMRRELAARLGQAADDVDDRTRHWYRIEQLCFDAEAGGGRAASVAAALRVLKAVPGSGADGEPVLDRVLRERSALVMAYAATRRGAAKSVGDAALQHYRTQLATNEKTLDWRYQIFRLTVALDRPDELITQLKEWVVPEKADMTWRRSLGYLLAERGELEEAVRTFEGVESADELSASDLTAMANWYLVLGDDVRREEAMMRRWRVSSVGQLSSVLSAARNKVKRRGGGLPGALSPDDLRAIRMLLTKANRPENYMWQVQDLYRACKDFRVLSCLPYGVVGHTSGSIYRYLARVGQMITQVHEEATCDSLAESIQEITAGAERTVDRRGLLLITSQVERRAAEVLNAPGDHIDKALAAMRAAFKGEWERGERGHMASYLASLGRIKHGALAQEQLRELRELLMGSNVKTIESLNIARDYAKTLWSYNRRDAAIDTLTMALRDYRGLFKGVLPRGANNVVSTLMGYYRNRRHYVRGEIFLLAERQLQAHQNQKNWYTQQLDALYIDCLSHHGEVSLGRGEKLYLAHRELLSKRMWEGATDVMDPAFTQFLNLHATAKGAGIRRAKPDLLTFARKTLPEFAERFILDQGNRINRVASTVRTVVDVGAALDTLVTSLEQEPKWLRAVNREYWRSFHWSLAKYRKEAHNAALDARLLPLALRELRVDLGRRNWRSTSLFYQSSRYFWSGAAGDFARVANEFIADNSTSATNVMFAANFLWSGLAQREAAIVALADLHQAGRLQENGQWQLARWYTNVRDYDPAISILKALVAKREDRLPYRILLIGATFKSGDDKTAATLMLATAKKWQAKKWWNENSIASLAKAAFESENWKEAAQWYEEAVRANERGSRRPRNWRNTRSGYYGFLARAHAKIGNTDAAVDAASAAVVTWGNDQSHRRVALRALHRVLRGIGDLDGYVARWDAKVKETGLDAPLIRKYLGIVYLENGEATRAIGQLVLARELQPNDDDVHKRLLSAYDRKGDKSGAIEALKTSIAMSPMNLDLYSMLARRLTEADDKVGAERAYTSMVEVKPNESDSHRRLAQVRENQRRYKDAVVQWRQVIRVRSLEPDGWLGLANSQIRARDYDGARKSIDHVLNTEWEARFKDAKKRARGLNRVLTSRRG